MTGLLLKDILNLKKYWKTLLGIIVIYGLWSCTMDNPFFLGSFVTLLFVMSVLTSFSYDETSKWNSYGLSLPIKRNDFVYSKYMLSLLCCIIGQLLGFAFVFGFYLVKKQAIPTTDFIANMMISLLLSAFYVSLIIPIVIKMGVEKIRFVSVAIFLTPVLIGVIITKMIPARFLPSREKVTAFLNQIENTNPAIIIGSALIVITIFISISCVTSCRIFQKKEY